MKDIVLIIDDDPVYQLVVKSKIGKIEPGLEILCCEYGRLGLNKLETILNGYNSIIVLLDINMPVMNGWEFLTECETARLHDRQNLRIFIVSSSTDKSDVNDAGKSSLVSDYFSKPLSNTDLLRILKNGAMQ